METTKILTAKEAHKTTDNIRLKKMTIDLIPIMLLINDGIENGKYYIDVYDDSGSMLNDITIKYLKELGYTVTANINNTCYDRISW